MRSNESSNLSIKQDDKLHELKNKTKKEVIIELVKEWQHSFDVDKKD